MKENVTVPDKGQITLPSPMRRSLGLGKSAVLIAEQVGARIALTPALVVETELYSHQQIAGWDRADAFGKNETDELATKLKKRRRA